MRFKSRNAHNALAVLRSHFGHLYGPNCFPKPDISGVNSRTIRISRGAPFHCRSINAENRRLYARSGNKSSQQFRLRSHDTHLVVGNFGTLSQCV